ncbi:MULTISPECIES: copper chaperone CopZ [Neobacillus]|jgi:copper chaperone|uniref:Copper chaperone CopZ n=2 Tax=Neobacillus TaxID=2675232 RepID=A0A6B3TMA2_9BACI|nr:MULTISPECIES: copper chaperone CopZ [Neobacillus]AIM14983.1 copper resistance protein CopZ [Bacillus sp. X1(2014)]MCD4839650.1 copper chaperone CopZ [Neobacillus sedimentimangrovi]MED3623970.1 copper chaperone CopZ [Neobacillus thermocopriae]MED3713835.1 copper chaperone CopZ [Neobacillus thermocopriae]NEX78023.1 copper chaperone CopZ [Neobacillus thermocopriae]
MEHVTLNVKGMSCNHCVKAIESSVGELDGVKNVSVNLEKGQVEIEFDSSVVTLSTIKETIDDQGYDVE